MQNTTAKNLIACLLPLALTLPMVGCMMDMEDEPLPEETGEEMLVEDGVLAVVSPQAGCTVTAGTPWRGTRYQNGITYDAVIGSASVSCSSATNISVTATLRNQTTGRNGYWSHSCIAKTSCWVEVWLTYSSGRWYTEGYSPQASPSTHISGWRDL